MPQIVLCFSGNGFLPLFLDSLIFFFRVAHLPSPYLNCNPILPISIAGYIANMPKNMQNVSLPLPFSLLSPLSRSLSLSHPSGSAWLWAESTQRSLAGKWIFFSFCQPIDGRENSGVKLIGTFYF